MRSENWQRNFKSLRRRFLIEGVLLVVNTVIVYGSPSQRLMSTRIAQQRKTHGGRSWRPLDVLIKLLGCRENFFTHYYAYAHLRVHPAIIYHLGNFFTHMLTHVLTHIIIT